MSFRSQCSLGKEKGQQLQDLKDPSWVLLDEFNQKPFVDYFQFSNSAVYSASSIIKRRNKSFSEGLGTSQIIENLHSVSDWYQPCSREPKEPFYHRSGSEFSGMRRHYSGHSIEQSINSYYLDSCPSGCSCCIGEGHCETIHDYDVNWKNIIFKDVQSMFSLRHNILLSITLSHFFAFAVGVYIGNSSLRRKH